LADRRQVELRVNGRAYSATVEPRLSLVDLLRNELGLTGTHVGCEHGVCGACTVLVNGETVRGCLFLAVQAQDAEVTTIEGVAGPDRLHPVQQAFREHHAIQCGFCTPGMVLSAIELLQGNPDPSEAEIREGISGNLCMCTGYVNIVKAVQAAATALAALREPMIG